jgi:hypothetical protein
MGHRDLVLAKFTLICSSLTRTTLAKSDVEFAILVYLSAVTNETRGIGSKIIGLRGEQKANLIDSALWMKAASACC